MQVRGLDPEAVYENEETKERYTGDVLMYAGVQVPEPWGETSKPLWGLSQSKIVLDKALFKGS
mgnify:CR=1 FL=1